MAKDKSTKSKGGDDFAKPSDAPATGGDGFKAESEDNVGKLFLITPLRVDSVSTDSYGDAEVIVADVVVIDKKRPEKSEEHEGVYFFGGWTKGSLRGYIGERKVLGILGQDASKTKSKAKGAFAWVLEDADEDDVAAARAYLDSVDPFAVKGAKAGKAEKKSKK